MTIARLIDQTELLFFNPFAQTLFHLATLYHLFGHFGRIKHPLVTPGAFRFVQCDVREAQKLARVDSIVRRDSHANTGADDNLMPVNQEGARNLGNDTFAQGINVLPVTNVGDNQDKLVSALARHQIVIADTGP